jgi:hypothetical protein
MQLITHIGGNRGDNSFQEHYTIESARQWRSGPGQSQKKFTYVQSFFLSPAICAVPAGAGSPPTPSKRQLTQHL